MQILPNDKNMTKKIDTLLKNVNELMTDNAELKRVNRETLQRVESLESGQENGDVIFYVHLSDGDYSATEGGIIQYDVIVTNLGNGYNPASRSFTCLQNGYYFFTIFFQTVTGTNTDLAIMVNNNIVCRGDAMPDNYDQGTCTAVVELQVGDVVNVKVVYGGALLNGGEGGYINGFTGFLYYAL